jgi:hypothetical protein
MTEKQTRSAISEEIFGMEIDGECRAQPSLVIPDNASPPKLHTVTGLKIRIPVLKRKREEEWVKFPSVQL